MLRIGCAAAIAEKQQLVALVDGRGAKLHQAGELGLQLRFDAGQRRLVFGDLAREELLEVEHGAAYSSTITTARVQPAEAPRILVGKQAMV